MQQRRSKAPESGKTVIVGRVAGVYGIKGWVKILSFTDPPENIFKYQPWNLNTSSETRVFEVEDGKFHGKGLIAKLIEVDDRNAAEELKGYEIAVDRSAFPKLQEGEFYWDELIGLSVVTIDGEVLGTVDNLFETGSNDVIVVKGDRERYVPYIRGQVIKTIDLEKKQITVDWPSDF